MYQKSKDILNISRKRVSDDFHRTDIDGNGKISMDEKCDPPTRGKNSTQNETKRKNSAINETETTMPCTVAEYNPLEGYEGLLKYYCSSRFAEANLTDCQMDKRTYMYRELSLSLGCDPALTDCFDITLKHEIDIFLTNETVYKSYESEHFSIIAEVLKKRLELKFKDYLGETGNEI